MGETSTINNEQMSRSFGSSSKAYKCKRIIEKKIKKYPTAAGKTGRRRQVKDIADLLRFTVSECGAPTSWMPPEKQFLTK